MKLQALTLILIVAFGISTSCHSDDDGPVEKEKTINGVWNLKNVSGGLQGINLDYNKGEVLWTFNETTGKLIVENNVITQGPKNIHSGLRSGTYNYEIKEEEGSKVLFVKGIKRGIITTLRESMKIDDGVEVDGFINEFER
ncbi:hypothetical protein ATO12_18380 [Aquimarina atlantica]|uniref:Lipocalin-like domain-containing protein n=1 Tax=Aquimarina atlantica TaxID=1317122 RepID=A0A023BSM1_9FLAO|nr:hypothetical protein [Aquimarina atlantica]EZH72985.1 hypothetical protein ATO12_18380 [Aquimarina atlantica]